MSKPNCTFTAKLKSDFPREMRRFGFTRSETKPSHLWIFRAYNPKTIKVSFKVLVILIKMFSLL